MSNITSAIDSENLTDNLEIDKIYQYGLYAPRNTKLIPDDSDLVVYGDGGGDSGVTFESLNGDLGKSNIQFVDPGTGIEKPKFNSESFKIGSFARGYFYGFDFPARYHEAQFSQDAVKSKNNEAFSPKRYLINSYSLCANVFIPYDSVVFISYQGFFCSESYKKITKDSGLDVAQKYYGNRFNHHLYIDRNRHPSMKSTAPTSKMYQEGTVSPREYRWRWQNRSKMVYLSKGYHEIELCVEGCLFTRDYSSKVDQTPQKLQHRCGSMSICAIKSGSQSDTRTPFWAYMKSHPEIDVFVGDIEDGGWAVSDPVNKDDVTLNLESFLVVDPGTAITGSGVTPKVGVGFGSDLLEEDLYSVEIDPVVVSSGDSNLRIATPDNQPKTVTLTGETVTGSSD